jgi:hypothetical protein
MLADKAPGPDRFLGLFFQAVWPIIKMDIMRALIGLWSLDGRSLYLHNQAYLVLLRKKIDLESVKDFRPSSLLHSFGKLFAKILSSQLAPLMPSLVMKNQSTFIKGRAIHDNFKVVHSTAKLFHARNRASILFKINIAMAFDIVTWAFLIELLRHLGFSRRWINRVSSLLSTSST